MPQLDPAIVAGLSDPTQRTNFIVEILTTPPRRYTPYRGLTADHQLRGLIVSPAYYRTADITVPGIEEKDSVGPITLTISIGNADNKATDLVANSANLRKRINISKVHFNADASAAWAGSPPTVRGIEPWFEGFLGRPRFRGEYVDITCHADLGRRGKTPRTMSRSLMTSHTPASQTILKFITAA
jgi:hypothetical protein